MTLDEKLSRLSPRQRKLLAMALAGDSAARLWLKPWMAMPTPDPWQRRALIELVTKSDNVLMCCTRGGGKTETFACAAYLEACLGGYALILARSERQSLRMIARAVQYANR